MSIHYLEVLVEPTHLDELANELARSEGLEVEMPVQSRDPALGGLAVLTVAASAVILVNGLIELKARLEKRPKPITVVIRDIGGEEIELKNVSYERLSALLGKSGMAHTEDASLLKILFLAANPPTTSHLDLEEELRNVEVELRGVRFRERISFAACHAVRPDDLIRHVRSIRPRVIQFSGHGSDIGIMLRNEAGSYTEVDGRSLRRFLEGRGVDLLVLNACLTKTQAIEVGQAVGAVVGTTSEVDDEASRRFSVAFYRSLGEGLSIREAFRDGSDAVVLHGFQDVFWSSGDLDRILLP